MTIKIFNDDPDGHYAFPVITTGQGPPAMLDAGDLYGSTGSDGRS